ncbi:MAG: type II secretion system protein, partial [Planctomycetota bacterium]
MTEAPVKMILITGQENKKGTVMCHKPNCICKEVSVADKCNGFTLVEVLTVVAIITILIGALIVVGSGYGSKARAAKTQGIIGALEIALESYHSEFYAYPPDGYDSPVTVEGYTLRGSACLTYFLMWKLPHKKNIILKKESYAEGNERQLINANGGRPYLGTIELSYISKDGEVLDGWENPLHYDNVEYDPDTKLPRYTPNPKGMHNCSDPDPRESASSRGTSYPGSYDIWSNGKDG